MARTWRLYHPDLPASSGASFELEDQEAHHVRKVLRLAPGERVSVFDGAGSEWAALVETSDRRAVRLRLEHPVDGVVEPELEIVLYQALCKPERMEWLLQKATEVGISEIRPFASERSGPHRVTDNRMARWRRIVIEAAKQSGRRVLPAIETVEELPAEPSVPALLLDPGPVATPLARVCEGAGAAPVAVWLAVGPESGFEEHEVAAWIAAGWRRVGLGPRILRADTAGVIAAAILLHRWGDLGAAAGPRGMR